MIMMWILVVCASFCELGFTICMKLSDGFYIDSAYNSAGDIPAVDISEDAAPRYSIRRLDRAGYRVHRTFRYNRVRRKPRQKEDAVYDHGGYRSRGAEALFIERPGRRLPRLSCRFVRKMIDIRRYN